LPAHSQRDRFPAKSKKAEFVTGTPKEAAAKLVEKLKHEARVLQGMWRRRPAGATRAVRKLRGLGPMNILLIPEQRDAQFHAPGKRQNTASHKIKTRGQ
jgi:hypothetical protein